MTRYATISRRPYTRASEVPAYNCGSILTDVAAISIAWEAIADWCRA